MTMQREAFSLRTQLFMIFLSVYNTRYKNRTAAVLYIGIGGAEESSAEPVIITRIRSAGIFSVNVHA